MKIQIFQSEHMTSGEQVAYQMLRIGPETSNYFDDVVSNEDDRELDMR